MAYLNKLQIRLTKLKHCLIRLIVLIILKKTLKILMVVNHNRIYKRDWGTIKWIYWYVTISLTILKVLLRFQCLLLLLIKDKNIGVWLIGLWLLEVDRIFVLLNYSIWSDCLSSKGRCTGCYNKLLRYSSMQRDYKR